MKSFLAFMKKEITEQTRSGKLMILTGLFVLFGIMNPAVAKLTPWLLEVMADSMAESGMTVSIVSITAMDSWVQFFKNIPMALIVFVLMQSSIFAKEYSSGTLILSLTKGLERFKVVIAKALLLFVLWSVGYWLCFGITYGYNAYFWDNAVAQNLLFSAVCWWLFGVWVIALTVLFSTLASTNTGVLLGTGIIVLVSYLVGLLPKFSKYLPTRLTDGTSLIYGTFQAGDYTPAIVITATVTLIGFALCIPLFNKKAL